MTEERETVVSEKTPAGWGTPVTIAGVFGLLGTAIANIERLEPFLDRQGMNALIVLTGLGMLVTFFLKVVPAIEKLLETHRKSQDKLSDNYVRQTTILEHMSETQSRHGEKLDDIHNEIVIRRRSD